jgi:predicted hydrolase (HD superfamily)
MDRSTAYQLVCEKITQDNLIKHIISVEAVMRRLATHFQQDPERWGLVGLLHDLDYAETVDTPERHTFLTKEWLAAYPEIDADMLHAIVFVTDGLGNICHRSDDWTDYGGSADASV